MSKKSTFITQNLHCDANEEQKTYTHNQPKIICVCIHTDYGRRIHSTHKLTHILTCHNICIYANERNLNMYVYGIVAYSNSSLHTDECILSVSVGK